MTPARLQFVFLGLSITSSWGNGHATTYRALVRELGRAGHDVLFLEREQPWYAAHRDLRRPEGCRTELYPSLDELRARFAHAVASADIVIVGSYVPEGVAVIEWVLSVARGAVAFYDIDTPVTLARLDAGEATYVSRAVIPHLDLYLSFSGGPTLDRLEREYGARASRPLYCSVDSERYYPEPVEMRWDLGYLGTYSADRQPTLKRLLLCPAYVASELRYAVAGPQYPPQIAWPPAVERIDHLEPARHRWFYNAQRFTLNVTRADMIRAGHSPSVRLFEAAACGTPIITDWWPGLRAFFTPGEDILVARRPEDTLRFLREMGEEERRAIGVRARARVLEKHTAAHRASELAQYAREALRQKMVA